MCLDEMCLLILCNQLLFSFLYSLSFIVVIIYHQYFLFIHPYIFQKLFLIDFYNIFCFAFSAFEQAAFFSFLILSSIWCFVCFYSFGNISYYRRVKLLRVLLIRVPLNLRQLKSNKNFIVPLYVTGKGRNIFPYRKYYNLSSAC